MKNLVEKVTDKLLYTAVDRIAKLEEDLRFALPYVKTANYNIALAMQIEAHLEGREPWEMKENADETHT